MSAGRGIPACVPGRVAAVAAAADAAVIASAGPTPAARDTASAPTNVSPAPTVSRACTAKAGTVLDDGSCATWYAAPAAPAVTTALPAPAVTRSAAARAASCRPLTGLPRTAAASDSLTTSQSGRCVRIADASPRGGAGARLTTV